MRLTYVASATVVIEHEGVKCLCDPWFTDGIYMGSWYHVPRLEARPEDFADVDFIYISHVHPDHCDIEALKRLPKTATVLIAPYAERFLATMLRGRGYKVRELQPGQPFYMGDAFFIEIMAADACNPQLCGQWIGCQLPGAVPGLSYQIDSLAWFQGGKRSILNTNDCPFGLARQGLLELMSRRGKPDMLLVGYSGASCWPQCFDMPEQEKRDAAAFKVEKTVNMAMDYVTTCKPQWFLPFAGQYTLGGRLFELNQYRGQPDLDDLHLWMPSTNMVRLNRGGWSDLDNGQQDAPFQRTDPTVRAEREAEIQRFPMPYDNDERRRDWDILGLLQDAQQAMWKRCEERGLTTDWCLRIRWDDQEAHLGFRPKAHTTAKQLTLTVDPRLLVRLLKRQYHWNQAEIGSHLQYARHPNVYERAPYLALSYLHV
jgi:UDP-MurNAc hydroxylase